jgi:hypothetical protein
LSWDIVDAMSTVKELVLSPAGTEAEPPVAGLDEVPALAEAAADAEVGEDAEVVDVDDEHPAATMAAAAATATKPNRGRDLIPWPCERGGRPPRPLLSSSIPYLFRHNALGYADAGHRTTRVSFRVER